MPVTRIPKPTLGAVSDAELERQYIGGAGWKTVEADSGGSQPFSGFQVYLSDLDGWDSDGGPVPYDGVAFDTDGYWSVVGKEATIPVGKAGVYVVSTFTYVGDVDTLDGVQGIAETGTPDDWENGFDKIFVKALNGNGTVLWVGDSTWFGRYAEADTISFSVGWHPFAIPTINIGSASYLTAILLGNPQ